MPLELLMPRTQPPNREPSLPFSREWSPKRESEMIWKSCVTDFAERSMFLASKQRKPSPPDSPKIFLTMNLTKQTTTNTETTMNMNNETQIAAACLRSCHKIITQLEKVRESIVAGYRGLVESNDHLLELTLNE